MNCETDSSNLNRESSDRNISLSANNGSDSIVETMSRTFAGPDERGAINQQFEGRRVRGATCGFSAQHSVIEVELLEVRRPANQTEHELSELTTEIGSVCSAPAWRADMAN
jgi:hypothetical protein